MRRGEKLFSILGGITGFTRWIKTGVTEIGKLLGTIEMGRVVKLEDEC